MVQRKVQVTKPAGHFQDDRHTKPKKRLDSSSQNLLEGKSKVSEYKKIMKKSASIKLSQDHHIKNAAQPEKKLVSANLENGCKGSELKKIMRKKVPSIELSDVDNLISLPHKENLPQPGKPPTSQDDGALVPSRAEVSRESPKPNYMKATSCWDARKDSKQVSVRTDVGSSITGAKNQARRNLKNSKFDQSASASASASGNTKSGRSLTKSSSLKLGRTLAKSPSFKQSGSSKKNRSKKAVLCADIDVRRATCSSLLKDSKFPSYVTLRPGGTESEGWSVMKVCTYKYCSLNGHHHALVPPLKSFIAARRRSLKNQKSMKLLDTETKAEKETGLEVPFVKDKVIVEIYTNGNEENAEPTETDTNTVGDAKTETETGLVRGSPSDGCSEEDDAENTKEKNDERTSTVGNTGRAVEAQHDEELYESLWEAYEMEWQEFEFLDAYVDDNLYMKEEVEEAKFDCRSESSFEGSISVAEDDVRNLFDDEVEGVCQEKDQTVEDDDLVYDNCISEQGDHALIELNEDDSKQKVTRDVLPENLVSDTSAQNFGGIEQVGNEAERADLDTGFDAGENGDEDEEDETKKSSSNQESGKVDETVTPHEGHNVAEETANTDTKKADLCKDDNEVFHGEECTNVGSSYCRAGKERNQDHSDPSYHLIITRSKAEMEDLDNTRGFNPQDPNFLPLEPEPEPEKVDLRHQDIDERKNSEEWMVDYALQKTLTQLAPVKRKKVELLVEAFEAVAPTPKQEHLSRRASYPLPDIRTIQPCN